MVPMMCAQAVVLSMFTGQVGGRWLCLDGGRQLSGAACRGGCENREREHGSVLQGAPAIAGRDGQPAGAAHGRTAALSGGVRRVE
jgi:hypothetical protein